MALIIKPQSPLQSILSYSRHFTFTGAAWGFGFVSAATLLLSTTPLLQQRVLSKAPLLGNYFTDKTPASDKPF
ncbi:hypothetical protein EV122DRAFT_258005 [Schizophyllum commune]|nr:uncharacterized protein SCHCODRAFT_02607363 [Schizophyllum commune H4-8]KAI4525790.1 hypothetical protein K525DRAFT_260613 [Schizophyllum commune Loenen D]KAI5827957.1 hypothetical protein K523DRAFT_321738 [Schizophyllum commune Tattone D]KAI5900225.1 hypothetical protein SCHCODRAFT_02607363 [Schizophyllum commune H4-8]